MDKEKILSTLADKLGKTSLSERTLEAYVTNSLPSEGEEPTDEWYNGAVSFLTAVQGQYNSDVAKFRREWEASHDTGNNQPGTADEKPNDDAMKLIEELRASQEKLRETLEQEVNSRKERERINQLRDYMQSKGASDDYVLDNVLKGAEFPDGKTIEEIGDTFLSKYDAELIKARGASATPRVGDAGGDGKQPSAADAYFAAKKRRMGKN